MDYYKKLSNALLNIEKNLFESDLVKNLHCELGISKYHFHRIFLFGTQYTLGEYVRRRRFTEIEKKLINRRHKIIDVALDSNYASPEAFSRAFKSYFGVTPSKYISAPVKNPLLLQQTINLEELSYSYYQFNKPHSIIDIPDLHILSAYATVNFENNKLPQIWKAFREALLQNGLDNNADCAYTVWLNKDQKINDLSNAKNYDIAIGVPFHNQLNTGLSVFTIPNGRYVCFSITQNYNYIYQTYAFIYFSWLEKNNCTLSDGLVFEEYSNDFSLELQTGEMKIYIPIEKQ